jgi:hypothetical protein
MLQVTREELQDIRKVLAKDYFDTRIKTQF